MWIGGRRAGIGDDFYWQKSGAVVPIDDRWEYGEPDMGEEQFGMFIRSIGTPAYGWNDLDLDTPVESLCEAY